MSKRIFSMFIVLVMIFTAVPVVTVSASVPPLQDYSGRNLTTQQLNQLISNQTIPPTVTHLDLSNNQINSVARLADLPNLVYLNLSDNQIAGTHASLSQLTNLKFLDLSGNQISNIPVSPNWNGLSNLEHLDLSNNLIAGGHVSLNQLTSLEHLDLSGNQITNIPVWNGLMNLKHLNLSGNQIFTNLINLEQLMNLEYLDLSDNGIANIPFWNGLANLAYLDLSDNQIAGNLINVNQLVSLAHLNLSGNLIKNLPTWTGLVSLRQLYLNNNSQISSIEPLNTLINLEELQLNGNPLILCEQIKALKAIVGDSLVVCDDIVHDDVCCPSVTLTSDDFTRSWGGEATRYEYEITMRYNLGGSYDIESYLSLGTLQITTSSSDTFTITEACVIDDTVSKDMLYRNTRFFYPTWNAANPAGNQFRNGPRTYFDIALKGYFNREVTFSDLKFDAASRLKVEVIEGRECGYCSNCRWGYGGCYEYDESFWSSSIQSDLAFRDLNFIDIKHMNASTPRNLEKGEGAVTYDDSIANIELAPTVCSERKVISGLENATLTAELLPGFTFNNGQTVFIWTDIMPVNNTINVSVTGNSNTIVIENIPETFFYANGNYATKIYMTILGRDTIVNLHKIELYVEGSYDDSINPNCRTCGCLDCYPDTDGACEIYNCTFCYSHRERRTTCGECLCGECFDDSCNICGCTACYPDTLDNICNEYDCYKVCHFVLCDTVDSPCVCYPEHPESVIIYRRVNVGPRRYNTNLTELSFIWSFSGQGWGTGGPGQALTDEDIKPLKHMVNLNYLYLINNHITDLTPLSELYNLETLHLSINNIEDLTPLYGLSNLRHLYLHNNPVTASEMAALQKALPNCQIYHDITVEIGGVQYNIGDTGISLNEKNLTDTDIESLRYMTRLRYLTLYGNNITDISPLSELTFLEYLNLSNNNITDITPISEIRTLQYLDMSNNNLDAVTLTGFHSMTYLRLDNNLIETVSLTGFVSLSYLQLNNSRISDVTLGGLPNLSYLDAGNNQIRNSMSFYGLGNLSYLDLKDNLIVNLEPLAGLTNLSYLDLSNSQVVNLTPLAGLTRLSYLNLSNNQVEDIIPLIGISSLSSLYLSNNPLHSVSIALIPYFKTVLECYVEF